MRILVTGEIEHSTSLKTLNLHSTNFSFSCKFEIRYLELGDTVGEIKFH